MQDSKQYYENPLIHRYASEEMLLIFSPSFKFSTWRRLWIALAETERELGLPISEAQIEEMKLYQDDINYEVAAAREKETRHDVMSHVHAFGEQARLAAPIMHLGATSAFVGDNTDLIQMRAAMRLVIGRLARVMKQLSDFALKHAELPTLGYTHFQPAQLTTVGKRASLWLAELEQDLVDLHHFHDRIRMRGAKGTTGTQASYLTLFHGDEEKVLALDEGVARRLGFTNSEPITGQTSSRKIESRLLSALSGLAQSAHRITNDIRLLQNLKEVEEPFGHKQIGSSAMAYKRNPMRSERVASLSKYLMSLPHSTALTAATQWFERTLDDSANKRLAVAQGFLTADAILILLGDITNGLVVYPRVIERRIREELPFIATENIMMRAVEQGGDRQKIHEQIRTHSMAAARVVKEEGGQNDLLERLADDDTFPLDRKDLDQLLQPTDYIGLAPRQVRTYIREQLLPRLEKYENWVPQDRAEVRV